MSLPTKNTAVRLDKRPSSMVVPGEHLVVYNEKFLVPDEFPSNSILLRRLYLSLDPAMRGWMNPTRSYVAPIEIGAIMRGHTISQVVKSSSSEFKIGDLVEQTENGWCEYILVDAAKVKGDVKLLPPLPKQMNLTPLVYLTLFGYTGMTAYFGFFDIGKPKPGKREVVVVSGAYGATGSVVCQLAKSIGCIVIGIAGGSEKCSKLVTDIGVDASVDYKLAKGNPRQFSKLLIDALKKVGSRGIDIFFDNVGGMIINESMKRLNMQARVVLCGAISGYNGQIPALENYMVLLQQRASMEGFVVFDYRHRFPEAREYMTLLLKEGKLKDLVDLRKGGLAQSPETLNDLFTGKNSGKLVIQVNEPIPLSGAKM